MSLVIAALTNPAFLATVGFAVPLLLFAVFFQPIMPARHREGVRATRVIRRLQAEQSAYRRPTGWASPAWTVQTGDAR